MDSILGGLMLIWIIFGMYCGIFYARKKIGLGNKLFYGVASAICVIFSAFLYGFLIFILSMAYFFGTWNIIHDGIGLIGILSILAIAFVLPINLFSIGAPRYKKILGSILKYSVISYISSLILAYIGMFIFGLSQ